MKKFLIISLLALLACSCTKFYKIDSEYPRWICEKKIDGKTLYGVVWEHQIQLFGQTRGFITEAPRGYPFRDDGIKCQYDSISYTKVYEEEMFVCYSNNEAYYYDINTNPYAEEKPVFKVEYMADATKGMCFGNPHDFKFYTADGVYSKDLGPYEDISVDTWGYAVKQNGKWGFFRGRFDIGKRGEHFKQLTPFEYDEFIDMSHSSREDSHVLMARQGSTWHGYNSKGQKIRLEKAWLQKGLKTKKASKYRDKVTFHFNY